MVYMWNRIHQLHIKLLCFWVPHGFLAEEGFQAKTFFYQEYFYSVGISSSKPMMNSFKMNFNFYK